MAVKEELRERELEILKLVATGASNKEIASRLHISTNTVKVHLRNIFSKIGVSSRTEAAMFAVSSGIVRDFPAGEERFPPGAASGDAAAGEPPAPSGPAGQPIPAAQRVKNGPLLIGAVVLAVALLAVLLIRPGLDSRAPQVSPAAGLPEARTTAWSELAPLSAPRSSLALVAYADRIYAIAGQGGQGVTGIVERYDPADNRWQPGAAKPLPVKDIGAAVLSGKIYVPGGLTASGEVTDRLEIYDPVRDEWQPGAPLPQAVSAYALVTFDGNLYLFGGWDGERFLNTVYRYNPIEDEWQVMPAMPTARRYLGAAVSGRRVVVLGGEDQSGPLAANEAFYPDRAGSPSQAWQPLAPLPEPLYGMGVAAVVDMIYVIGGAGPEQRRYPLLAFDPNQGWRVIQDLPGGLREHPGVLNLGQYIYLAGGDIAGAPSAAFARYQAVYTVSIPMIIK